MPCSYSCLVTELYFKLVLYFEQSLFARCHEGIRQHAALQLLQSEFFEAFVVLIYDGRQLDFWDLCCPVHRLPLGWSGPGLHVPPSGGSQQDHTTVVGQSSLQDGTALQEELSSSGQEKMVHLPQSVHQLAASQCTYSQTGETSLSTNTFHS